MYTILLLAGGAGSRMKKLNDIPKVFQEIGGKPMLLHLIEKFNKLGFENKDIHIVFSEYTYNYATKIFDVMKHKIRIQQEPNGTGGAVRDALFNYSGYKDDETIMICNADNPFISFNTIKNMLYYKEPVLSTVELDNPTGYGRVIIDDGYITNIIEEKDCTDEQRKINLVNTSLYVVKCKILKDSLKQIDTNNAQKEYYLTDIVKHYPFKSYCITDVNECFNINTPEQLQEAEKMFNT